MHTKHTTSFTVYPEDCNYMTASDTNRPMVHGGYMLMRMDRVAAECARRALYSSVCDSALTVKVEGVTFYVGASLGDIIFLEAELTKVGIKSMNINVVGFREDSSGKKEKICDGTFVFVSKYGDKTFPHGLKITKEQEK